MDASEAGAKLADLATHVVDIFEGELMMSFADKKAQIVGTTKKAIDVACRLLGARAGKRCNAVIKLGYGYSLQARASHVAQKARFTRFALRNRLLRAKAGKRGRGAIVFHSGLLRGMLFGGELQDISPRRMRAMRAAAARARLADARG